MAACVSSLSPGRQTTAARAREPLDRNACFCPEPLARLSVSLLVLGFYVASEEDVDSNKQIFGGSPTSRYTLWNSPPLARRLYLVLLPTASSVSPCILNEGGMHSQFSVGKPVWAPSTEGLCGPERCKVFKGIPNLTTRWQHCSL